MNSIPPETQPRATHYVFRDDCLFNRNSSNTVSCGTTSVGSRPRRNAVDVAVPFEGSRDSGTHRGQYKRARAWNDLIDTCKIKSEGFASHGDVSPEDYEGDDDNFRHEVVEVVVHEMLSEDYGLFTWPSAVVLACMIWARRREFKDAHVVEIGAGTALPGLLAAKVGASVTLTDREGAPWLLDNMRGVVDANGLHPTPTSTDPTRHPGILLESSSGEKPMEAGTGQRICSDKVGKREGESICCNRGTSCASIEDPEGFVGDCTRFCAMRGEELGSQARGEGCLGDGRDDAGSAHGHRGGHGPSGTCTVQVLSWGSISPAALQLAAEHRPKFILGADIFYSSEDFDSVLATVHLLLAGYFTPGRRPQSARVDQETDDSLRGAIGAACVALPAVVTSGGRGTRDANFSQEGQLSEHNRSPSRASFSSLPATGLTQTARSTSRSTDGPGVMTRHGTERNGTDESASSPCAPSMVDRPVFLTAYHERSARRSLRPLLRKWGMTARVLRNAPQRVLPREMWESGRYDSIALIEITLNDPP